MQMMGADRLKNETMAEVKDGFKPGGFVHMFADGQRKDIMSDFKKVATKDLMKQVIRYVVIPLASAMLLIFAALVVIINGIVLQGASPIPFGDESAHLGKLFELQDVVTRSRGWLETFNRLAIAGDAYPNTIYTLTLPFIDEVRRIDDARGFLGWLSAAHAWVAMIVGTRTRTNGHNKMSHNAM